MRQEGVIQILGPIHKEIVQKETTYFLSIQERSLTTSKMRCMVSTNSVKEREPFNYGNFNPSASWLITYNNLILRKEPYWLGCLFRCPIIWYPSEGFRFDYELPEGHEKTAFANLAQHHSFRPDKETFSPAYSLTTLHRTYSFIMRT